MVSDPPSMASLHLQRRRYGPQPELDSVLVSACPLSRRSARIWPYCRRNSHGPEIRRQRSLLVDRGLIAMRSPLSSSSCSACPRSKHSTTQCTTAIYQHVRHGSGFPCSRRRSNILAGLSGGREYESNHQSFIQIIVVTYVVNHTHVQPADVLVRLAIPIVGLHG